MSQHELLIAVLSFLEEQGIAYMVTGSVVSSIQGQPRSTHDVDIVVSVEPASIAPLLRAFMPPRFYVSAEAVQDAIKRKSMFNLLDTSGGDKVDFWLLTDDAFDQSRFRRKYREEVPGASMFVSTPEDTILAKLRWAKLAGGSEKQMLDSRRVFEVQQGNLDMAYLEEWAAKLNVENEWEQVRSGGMVGN